MEAWNSGVITTWGEPLFGPVPRQPDNNATRQGLCRALQLTELTNLTISAASSGDTMFFIYPTHPLSGSVPNGIRYPQYRVGVRWHMDHHRRLAVRYLYLYPAPPHTTGPHSWQGLSQPPFPSHTLVGYAVA
jgi:hypothetical protein